MEFDDHPTPTPRPVLPWAVVFLASVLALQLVHVRQEREPDEGRSGHFRAP